MRKLILYQKNQLSILSQFPFYYLLLHRLNHSRHLEQPYVFNYVPLFLMWFKLVFYSGKLSVNIFNYSCDALSAANTGCYHAVFFIQAFHITQ